MFDIVLLRSFVAVVQKGGFSRAADELHLTQSAVSGHLRRLEEQVGQSLLARTTRSVALTPVGETLLGYAHAILALDRDARTQLARAPLSGTIRVGVSEDFAQLPFMTALNLFGAANPGVTLDVQVGIPGLLLQALDRGDFELVVGGHCHDERQGRALWREPLAWAISENGALDPSLPVPLAVFPDPCPYREAALTAMAQAGVEHRIAVVCPSGAGLRAAALAGFAVTPIPRSRAINGLRAAVDDERLPPLPDALFTLFAGPHRQPIILNRLADVIVAALVAPRQLEPPGPVGGPVSV